MRKATLSIHDSNVCFKPATCKRKTFRTTQIIASIPITSGDDDKAEKEELMSMIEAGLNIACFDASQGKECLNLIKTKLEKFREAVKEYNMKRCADIRAQLAMTEECDPKDWECMEVNVATALDLKSIYIETGTFAAETAETLALDDSVVLTNKPEQKDESNKTKIYVDYADLTKIPKNQNIVINECIILQVEGKEDDDNSIKCKVIQAGMLPGKDQKAEVNITGLKTNLGGVADDLQTMTTFCRNNDITMMFIPIENPQSMKSIKCVVNPDGDDKKIKVVAKVESLDSVNNIEQIIEKADGVCIGRDRLGRNVPTEQVTAYQKMIIAKCLKTGIPSIVLNNVMSKINADVICGPSRAETADVFNCVLDGVDCMMLDVKNSRKEAIRTLQFTIMEAEDMTNYRRMNRDLMTQVSVPCAPIHCGYFTDSLAIAATTCAMVNGASAIIVLTDNGRTAKYVSKYRPECPIIVVTKSSSMAERCLLHRGVISIVSDKFPANYEKNVEEKIKGAIMFLKSCHLLKKLPACVVVTYATKENNEKSDTVSERTFVAILLISVDNFISRFVSCTLIETRKRSLKTDA